MTSAMNDDMLSPAPVQTETVTCSASRRSRQRNKISTTVEAVTEPCSDAVQYGSLNGVGRGKRGGLGPLARLEREIEASIAESTLTSEEKARMARCTRELQGMVESIGSAWRLKLFGSAANGFGTRNSDVDATCIEESPGDEASGRKSAADILKEQLCPLLRGHPKFSIVEEVLGASIPILKLRFEGAIDVDLSCRNGTALQNTRLLRGYADLDGRVRDLGILVKLWAKAANVWGASRRFLSSYTFTLLAVYFMQVHPDVQLPCLPTGAFSNTAANDGQEEVATARSSWACPLSLAELLTRFFEFYHSDFDWGREVVCPRLGRRLLATDKAFDHLRNRWMTRLHVEDPYITERNLHCVLGPEVQERELRIALAEGYNALLMGVLPVGIGGLLSSPTASPCLLPEGDPDLLPLLVQEVDLGKGVGGCAVHMLDNSAEETWGVSDEFLREGVPSAGARKSSWHSSSAWGVASTASGVSVTLGDGSCTESHSSDDEHKAPERDEGGTGTFKWWKYLGSELNLLAASPPAGVESSEGEFGMEAGQAYPHAEQTWAPWRNDADIEEAPVGDGGAGRMIGVSEALTGTTFASRSSSRIAARLASKLATGGGQFAYQ